MHEAETAVADGHHGKTRFAGKLLGGFGRVARENHVGLKRKDRFGIGRKGAAAALADHGQLLKALVVRIGVVALGIVGINLVGGLDPDEAVESLEVSDDARRARAGAHNALDRGGNFHRASEHVDRKALGALFKHTGPDRFGGLRPRERRPRET